MKSIDEELCLIAAEVRRQRAERRWTLDQAAARLGLSRRSLVQIEAGAANPSLSTLLAIAAGYDIALADLMDGSARPIIQVQADNATAPRLWSTAAGSQARLLVSSRALELWEWTLAAGEVRVCEAHRRGSREAFTVTAGALTLTVGAAKPLAVVEGQSVLHHADDQHRYHNHTEGLTRFVLAVHEPLGPES